MTILNKISLSLIIVVFLLGFGCTSRIETPIMDENSTLIYPPKNADDVSVKITFCRKIDKKTGNLVGEGTTFTITNKSKIQAVVELENLFNNGKDELMFHLDWVGPDDKSIFLKRILLSPDDSLSIIKGSISVSAETREPGKYKLKIYYFRELIAEKSFELSPQPQLKELIEKGFSIAITLCRSVEKKSGERIGVDSIFMIKGKSKVRAYYDLPGLVDLGNRELLFYFDWIDQNDSSFYKKQIVIDAEDTTSYIGSSISITPGKREPGNYTLQLYLFNELLAENKFELIPEPEEIPINLNAKITLYRKLDKITGKRVDEGTIFTLKNKRKVRALIDILNRSEYIDRELKLQLEWIGPNGKSFYKKKIVFAPGDPISVINSSISISPDKRQAGEYSFRLFLFKELIAEKKFELRL